MKKLAIFSAIMVVGAGVAFAATLRTPFFLDNQSNNNTNTGVTGRIGVKEGSGADQTVTVLYTALDASGVPTNQLVTFFLGANLSLRWNPVQDNSAESSGPGSAVPNMTIAGPNSTPNTVGSAVIVSGGAISGNYDEIDHARGARSVHVLLPD